MAKSRKHSRRHRRRRHSTKYRKHRGGQSAWEQVLATVGNGQTQMQNSLELQPWQTEAQRQSNASVPVSDTMRSTAATTTTDQKGGRRRHRRNKRGGFLGSIISNALVPLSLLGLQQTYGRKRRGGRHTRTRKH